MSQKGLSIGVPAHYAGATQTSSGVKMDPFVAQHNVPPTPTELVLDLDNIATYED